MSSTWDTIITKLDPKSFGVYENYKKGLLEKKLENNEISNEDYILELDAMEAARIVINNDPAYQNLTNAKWITGDKDQSTIFENIVGMVRANRELKQNIEKYNTIKKDWPLVKMTGGDPRMLFHNKEKNLFGVDILVPKSDAEIRALTQDLTPETVKKLEKIAEDNARNIKELQIYEESNTNLLQQAKYFHDLKYLLPLLNKTFPGTSKDKEKKRHKEFPTRDKFVSYLINDAVKILGKRGIGRSIAIKKILKNIERSNI